MDTNRARSPQTASCMYTYILNQWIKHDQLSFRVYNISTVSLWTQTEAGVLSPHAACVLALILSQWIKHHQLSFRVYTISTVSLWIQSQESSDRMLHVLPSSLING